MFIEIKKIIRKLFPDNKNWERVKNYVRPTLLRLNLMPNIVRDDYAFYLPISKSFLEYINKNKEVIKKLEDNLDENSKKEIEHFLKNVDYISTHKILKRNILFTKEEIREQIESIRDINKKEKNYKKFDYFEYYPSETFYGLNGVKWLPEKNVEKTKNGVAFDIGACYGDSAIAFYYNIGIKNIYSFEPEPNNFKKLQKNLSLIKESGIVPVMFGASNENKTVKISDDTYTSKISDTGKEIKVVTIDSFVKEKNVEKVSLIKMDIEGEEMNALLGAVETIKKHKPVLSIAIYHKPEDFFEIKPWMEKNFPEYKYIIKKSNPFDPMVEVTLLAYTND